MNDTFFAPSNLDMIDVLIDEYNSSIDKINKIADVVHDEKHKNVLQFFESGLTSTIYKNSNNSKFFDRTLAIQKLTSFMWDRTLKMTDVIDFMPANVRDKWNEQIENHTLPEFTREYVRSGIQDLLSKRKEFFIDMIDGIFHALSPEHITNQPEGFSKRFIINNVYEHRFGILFFNSYSKMKFLCDLRFVIAKLFNRNDVTHQREREFEERVESLIETYGYGEWIWMDGYSIRMRFYKKGTVHVELHPDIVWRLNEILSERYPAAIPPKFTKKYEQKKKDYELINRVIPSTVVHFISKLKHVDSNENYCYQDQSYTSKHIKQEAFNLLGMLGGVVNHSTVTFEYDPTEILKVIISNCTIPDIKTHQYYPTPSTIADALSSTVFESVSLDANILEPSAGVGNIMESLIKHGAKNVHGNEISSVFFDVLTEKFPNNSIENTDFLRYEHKHDVIVMNPPFDQGRWKAHVQHALKLAPVVYAILPSAANYEQLNSSVTIEHQHFNDMFDNCTVNVKIVELHV